MRIGFSSGVGWRLVLLLLAIAAATALSLLPSRIGLVLPVAVFAFAYISIVPRKAQSLSLALLAFCLAMYALTGRGFAYIGSSSTGYVGDWVLALLAVTAALTVPRRDWVSLTSLQTLSLLLFILIGALRTIPYIPEYGMWAMRDAAVWIYAGFAVLLVVLLGRREKWLEATVGHAARYAPLLLPGMVLTYLAYRFVGAALPHHANGVPFLSPKPGDLGVHLAGALAFLVLGLDSYAPGRTRLQMRLLSIVCWISWLIGVALVSTNRGALLTIALTLFILLVIRPMRTWLRPVLLLSLAAIIFGGLQLQFSVGTSREISVDGIALALASIVEETGSSKFDGSREWRLAWWGAIIDYTFKGDYFLTGKGYGINLADADGFQVLDDSALRSPHNGHLNILARSGVPGLAAWTFFVITLAVVTLRQIRLSGGIPQSARASTIAFLGIYCLAHLVNASFDLVLEGPQSAIWFWTLVGLLLAASFSRPTTAITAPTQSLSGGGAPSVDL